MKGIINLTRKADRRSRFKNDLPFYIILLPTIIVVFLFSYLPLSGLLLAFKDYKPKLGIFMSPWTSTGGFANFVEVFKTPALSKAIVNTIIINLLTLALTVPLPVVFALLINEIRNVHFKKVVQTVSYLPHFLSWAAITGMANVMLNNNGIITSILDSLGLPSLLLEKESAFVPIYLFITIWQCLGWDAVIYLASISGISQDLYEAAEIDGAGKFTQALKITVPSLMPTMVMLLILKTGSILGSNFELVYGLQNPVAWKMEVIGTAVYKYGINQGQYSLATALGLMQGLISLALTFGVNAISNKLTNVSMW